MRAVRAFRVGRRTGVSLRWFREVLRQDRRASPPAPEKWGKNHRIEVLAPTGPPLLFEAGGTGGTGETRGTGAAVALVDPVGPLPPSTPSPRSNKPVVRPPPPPYPRPYADHGWGTGDRSCRVRGVRAGGGHRTGLGGDQGRRVGVELPVHRRAHRRHPDRVRGAAGGPGPAGRRLRHRPRRRGRQRRHPGRAAHRRRPARRRDRHRAPRGARLPLVPARQREPRGLRRDGCDGSPAARLRHGHRPRPSLRAAGRAVRGRTGADLPARTPGARPLAHAPVGDRPR